MIGKTPFDLMPPEEAERVLKLFRAITESKGAFDRLENTNLHKDGRLVVLETSGVPIFDTHGNYRGYRGIDRDITERKKILDELREHHYNLAEQVRLRTAEFEQSNADLKKEIEEREKTEVKLQQHRNWLKVTLSSIGDAVIAADLDEKVSFLNEEAERLTGWSASDAIGQSVEKVFKIINEQTKKTVESPVRKVLAEGKVVGLANDTLLISREDKKTPIADSGSPILDENGKLYGVVLVFRDVTEHKRIQGELKNYTEKLEKMVEKRTLNLENANIKLRKEVEAHRKAKNKLQLSERELALRNNIARVFLTKPDETMYGEVLHIILEYMDSKYGTFGYIDEQGDLVVPSMTRDIWEKCNIPEKDIIFPRNEWGDASWCRAIIEKKSNYLNEISTKTPPGHVPISKHISIPIVHKGEAVGLLQVANRKVDYNSADVETLETIAGFIAPILSARLLEEKQARERRQAEAALAESEKRLTTIFDTVQAGIIIIDAETRKIADANPVAVGMIGATRDEIIGRNCHKFICPAELGECPILDLGETCDKSEQVLLAADGKVIPVLKNVTSMEFAGRQYLLDSFIDISEIKQAELKLMEYSENLEEMVEVRTAELAEAQEQLLKNEKLAVLGQLAGGVGHELRNPLGVMKNTAYFLNLVLENIPEKAKQHLEIFNRQINIADEIISNLLDFATIKPPTLEITPVKMMIERAIEETDISSDLVLDLNLPSDVGAVHVDPIQIHSVLLNLFQNSVQAMPEGGELSISSCRLEGNLEISIADTGCGVPPELMDKIFEPLITTKPKGIGLGLAICRSLVNANKGQISLASKSGEGTVVRLVLPAIETGDRDEG